MAQSLYDVDTIFKRTYSLQVAVRCTSSAEDLCRKNSLTFCELVEPFSHLSSPGMHASLFPATPSILHTYIHTFGHDRQLEYS